MRKIFWCLLAISFGTTVYGSEYVSPEISLVRGMVFDSFCSSATNERIDPIAVDELQRELSEFELAWKTRGPDLLQETTKLIGGKVHFHDAQAALIFCGLPSMSAPMMVNMRAFIPATAKGEVSSTDVFCNTLYQLLLSRYIDDVFEARHIEWTPLLQKYKNESLVVRNNLHAYAIEKLVYKKLGRLSDLNAVAVHESMLRAAVELKRARDTVEEEGAERFVSELILKK